MVIFQAFLRGTLISSGPDQSHEKLGGERDPDRPQTAHRLWKKKCYLKGTEKGGVDLLRKKNVLLAELYGCKSDSSIPLPPCWGRAAREVGGREKQGTQLEGESRGKRVLVFNCPKKGR